MKKCYRRLFVFFLLLTAFNNLNATHLVGGVIYYNYLGNGLYEFTFEVYKDCSPGVALGFDGSGNPLPPFYFGIYEGTNTNNIALNNSLNIIDSVYISSIIVNPCLEKNNSCVIKGTYKVQVNLPKNNVGYTIQFKRCCRNDGINNILNQPGSLDKPGMTIYTYVPPYGTYANNSARFKNFPPIFICRDQPFYFDHSSTDADGDQLRYYLKTPLVGLSSERPFDDNPSREEDPIRWAPPYSLNNVMGGNPVLSIDSITGMLFCRPNSTGRFVVSILVKEIRNGVVINEFIRDFQYNVVECDIPFADMSFIQGTYDPLSKVGDYVTKCDNLTVNFDNTSTNSTSWKWNFGDPSSGNNNFSTQKTPSHTFSSPGDYRVVQYAFKRKGTQLCVDSTIRFVKLYPKLESKFTKSGFCVGEPISFTNNSTSDFGTITQTRWDFGVSTSSINQPSITFPNAGDYNVTLEVTNSLGCVDKSTQKITVYPKPVINADIKNACIGQTLNLECKTTVSSPSIISQYLWRLPDGSTRNVCNTTYLPSTFGTKNLTFKATTDRGCSTTKNFAVEVFPLPNIVTSEDDTLCYNETKQLITSGGISYEWSPTTFLSNPNIGNPIASPLYPNPIQYVVKGTDANGCYNRDTVNLSFFLKTTIDAGPDTSLCLNPNSPRFQDTVRLNGTGGPFNSIFWTPSTYLSNANISNPLAKPPANIRYVYHGIDTNLCENLDTIEIIVLDPSIDLLLDDTVFICQYDTIRVTPYDQGDISTYQWIPTFFVSNPNERVVDLYPLDTTKYILTVSNYCYTKQDSIVVNSSALPDPQMKDLDSICVYEIYQFNLNPIYPQYQWSTVDTTLSSTTIPNPTASPREHTWYYVTVTDIYSCQAKDSMLLEVNYPPSISIDGLNAYMCQGDSMMLTALTDKTANIMWWDSTLLEPDTGHVTYVFPFDTTQFFIEAISLKNCSNIDTFVVNVQKPIIPEAESPARMCLGTFVTLEAKGGLYYLWKPPYNISDTLIDTPQVFPDQFTNYLVKISNDCFEDSIYVDVYVDSLPEVKIFKDTTIYRGTETTLEVRPDVYDFEWYPKNEVNTPFSNTITVSPKDTTYYIVKATDGFGCKGYDTVSVYVIGKNVLLVPTGFTPNGDGINDNFSIVKHLNIETLNSLDVYNRWGEKVFTTQNINDTWDGTFRDKNCESGVYVWHVKAVTFDGEEISKSGNVTLIR